MNHTTTVSVHETCDSPVYVETSPVSSPVVISKDRDHEWTAHVTDKLILPELNESDIRGVVESGSSNSHNDPSASATHTTTPDTPCVKSKETHGTEMVTVVIKDFAYCKEEFLKKIKENNVSVSSESMMRLLRIAMVIVEQTTESGSKKKEFVITLLTELIMSYDAMLPDHKQEALNLIKGGVVSDAIDFLIDATRGKFDVNKVEKIAEEVAKSCFTACLERFLKKK
jgi:protein involved in ribonucleotide reduction